MHGSRRKIPSKKSRQAACVEGFNSGVKGLIIDWYMVAVLRVFLCICQNRKGYNYVFCTPL
jgi:hypothetical protein